MGKAKAASDGGATQELGCNSLAGRRRTAGLIKVDFKMPAAGFLN